MSPGQVLLAAFAVACELPPRDVDESIAAALAHNGPVLVDAVVSRTVLPVPPAITAEMAKGFTLYMVKAVFNRRGDDLVDLARSNLWA
jgi:pyruvate dehydrogenase (quinone)